MTDLSNPFTYKGHEVIVQTAERGGLWYWWYAIDTRQPIPMSETGAASATVAYLEARHDAERHIDLMG